MAFCARKRRAQPQPTGLHEQHLASGIAGYFTELVKYERQLLQTFTIKTGSEYYFDRGSWSHA